MAGARLQEQIDPLRSELDHLKRRGLGVVTERELRDRTPVLVGMALGVHGGIDAAAAVRRLLITASNSIGEVDVRAACRDLFGLTRQCAFKTLTARQEVARHRFTPVPAVSSFRQLGRYTPRIVDALHRAVVMTAAARGSRSAQRATVDRKALSAELRRLIEAGPSVVVVHGDAGMGKTELALSVAVTLSGRERADVPRIRLANSRVAELDVRRLLASVGQPDAAEISDGACLLRLHDWLAEPGDEPLVLDNASGVGDVEPYLPVSRSAARKIIATSRIALALPDSVLFRVSAYTADEAVEAVRILVPHVDAATATAIAGSLAAHPLAIDHVCRYLNTAKPEHVAEAVEALAIDAAATLSAIEGVPQNGQRLTVVYRSTLEFLGMDGPELTVLDFLLMLGAQGSATRYLADGLLAVQFPGPTGAVRVAAGLRSLTEVGLLDTDANAYTMHPLTAAMLGRLRRPSLWRAAERLVHLLSQPAAVTGSETLRMMAREFAASAGALADGAVGGDDRLLCLNEGTWLHLRIRDGESVVVRYTIFPERVTVETAEDEPRPVTLAEGKVLYRAVKRYGAVSAYAIHPDKPGEVLRRFFDHLKDAKYLSARQLIEYAFAAEPDTEWIRWGMGVVLIPTDPGAALSMLTSVHPPPHDNTPPADLFDLVVAYACTGDRTAAADLVGRLRATLADDGPDGEITWIGWRVAADRKLRFVDLSTAAEAESALREWVEYAQERTPSRPATSGAGLSVTAGDGVQREQGVPDEDGRDEREHQRGERDGERERADGGE